MISEPRCDEDGRGDHGGNFGDEDEGLFLNLREGLENGDGQADKESDQKQRRGDDEGNEKSLANKIAGLVYAHITPFPKCGRQSCGVVASSMMRAHSSCVTSQNYPLSLR